MKTQAVAERAAVVRAHPRRTSIVQLGRVEGKRLAGNLFVIMGILLSILATGIGRGGYLMVDDTGLSIMLFPMAGMVLIASNRAVLRSRRDDLDEQYQTMPVGPASRTLAHAVALAVPFAYACVFAVGWTLNSRAGGAIGWPNPVELLTGPVLVVSAGLVGILLARLVPRSALAPFMVIAIGFIQGGLSSDKSELLPLAPFMPTLHQPRFVEARPRELHLVYLLLICGALLAGAVMRHRRSRRVAVAFALSIALAAGAGVAQFGAQSPEHDAMVAAWVAHPEPFQTCRRYNAVTYCAYTQIAEGIDRWRPVVEGVLDATPASVRARPLTVRQRMSSGDAAGIRRAEIRALLGFGGPADSPFVWPDDGLVHTDLSSCWASTHRAACEAYLASMVASWAVGLPVNRTEPFHYDDDSNPAPRASGTVDAGGQARGVIALWLTLQSTPRVSRKPGVVPDPQEGVPAPGDRFDLMGCSDGVPVLWSYEDVGYARRLAALPSAEVAARLARSWSRLIHPRTTTAELVAMFDLEPPTPTLRRAPPIEPSC